MSSPGDGGGPQGPPAVAEPADPVPPPAPPAFTAPKPGDVRLRARIEELLRPDPAAGAAEALARSQLHSLLVMRFGPGLAGAALDRDWLLAALDREIAALDRLLNEQVNAILHAPPVQRLEARWRGLRYLADAVEEGSQTKIKLLSASWTEVVRDLERASDFDQSDLFRKVYSQEFGMPGGEPFGLIVADYEVQHRPTEDHPTDDVSALKALATVGAASFCPFVLGVSPRVFQVDSFRDFGRPFNLRTVFAQAEYQRWLSVRDGEDMRFIGLALPRILMRHPYPLDPARHDGFPFEEEVRGQDGDGHLWGAAGFAFARIVIRAFAQSGWFADLRGAPRDEERGGLVTDLPVVSFRTDRPGIAIKPSTECLLTEGHEQDLADLGFMALRKMPFTPYSVFYANPSIQAPKVYDRNLATVNARLSSMLQYILCVSRFAHYIKVMGRDRIGSVMTADECQKFLEKWLREYCEGSDAAGLEAKARRPLRAAAVEVREVAGRPGSYACSIFLRPHFQLDDISTGFRLTTELAPAGGA
ncbi:MAG TPA: type VI secretion system contractile sheath large subunit [Caulobacteraceae bacterium]|nr:type VI secretion system contractile sheath large subunit [Caulobacteraceae bacterium]